MVTNKSKGFFLSADEQVPLPEKLTRIANDLHAALPGVLAMTNSIHLTLATMSQGLTNLNEITAQMNSIMPKLQSAIGEAEGLLKDIRPLTQVPGGIGTLLIPTNLNLQLTSVLSNVNSRAELIGPTLSNINGVVGEVGETVAGIRAQLDRDTNLVSNINRLADTARSLADTAETLLKRHWFFRSAFKGKTNSVDGPSEPKANARPIHPSKW